MSETRADRQYHTLREQVEGILSEGKVHTRQASEWEILLFRRSLPILSTSRESGWSHVREVLRAPSQHQRLYYLRAADEGSWSVRQLRQAIRADAFGQAAGQPWAVPPDEDPHQGQPLRTRFGELHTYRVVPGADPASEELYLNLGFGVTCHRKVKVVPFPSSFSGIRRFDAGRRCSEKPDRLPKPGAELWDLPVAAATPPAVQPAVA